MKFEIDFERTYSHPINRVWRAISESVEISAWLMENDFKPELGRAFTMSCEDDDGGTDTYLCNVLELDPPRRMVWSWVLDGKQDQGETRVAFDLEDVEGGTRLTIRHSGDRTPDIVERFKTDWPVKLDQLAAILELSNRTRL